MKNSPLELIIVDDDNLILDTLEMLIPSQWQLTKAQSLKSIPHKNYVAALVDMHLTGNINQPEGLEVIAKLQQKYPHIEIVAMSGDLDRNLMEKCLKNGASRFLAKPLSNEEVLLTLEKIEAMILLRQAHFRPNQVNWVGSSSQSIKIKKQIASLKGESGPILIEGESGTGKEIVAQMLHQQEGGPFVSVNVTAIPENLFESELFGHVKGSFTGAEQNKIGLAEAAHGGDLFLDEIEALPLHLQVKLLRFLETGEVQKVGAKDSIKVNVRVIIASNKELNQLVTQQEFREDLLWRISGKKIQLPPLRDRKNDIEEIAKHFLQQERPRRNKTLDLDAIKALKEYNWPGNVRELKRVCEQLSLISPLPIIRDEDVMRVIHYQEFSPYQNSPDFSQGLTKIMEQYEVYTIKKCLEAQPSIDEAATLLKVSRSNLYKKIKDYNISYGENEA